MASLHHLRSTEMIEATSGDQRLLGSTNPAANETQRGKELGLEILGRRASRVRF